MNADEELKTFKRVLQINSVAAHFGYVIDQCKSSRHSAVMVGPNGHKIICAVDRKDGHGIFFSTNEDSSGSVIDLVMRITGTNLGRARIELRALMRSGSAAEIPLEAGGQLKPSSTDFLSVLARYSEYSVVTSHHPYLCDERRILESILLDRRFTNRIRFDPNSNDVVFPHFGPPDDKAPSERVLTGFQIKGSATRFSRGGRKGLWPSNALPTDNQLVICESEIDALSWSALHARTVRTRYISFGGQMNPIQPILIDSAIKRLPCGEVVLACDNDEAGKRLTTQLAAIFKKAARHDLTLRFDHPKQPSKDWNEALVSASPLPYPGPSS